MSAARAFALLIAFASLLSLSACGARVVVLKDPLTAEEHINLAVAYEREGKWDAALKHYETASRELPAAYLYMGNVYFQKGEPREAEKSYRKAIKKDPLNADAMNNLAWLYCTEGKNLDEAEELALEALRLNPAKSGIYGDTLKKIRALKQSGAAASCE